MCILGTEIAANLYGGLIVIIHVVNGWTASGFISFSGHINLITWCTGYLIHALGSVGRLKFRM